MPNLPLLLFPAAIPTIPNSGRFFPHKPQLPSTARQSERISPKLQNLNESFAGQAQLLDLVSGAEPEFVLVIETAGKIEDIQQAIANTEGLDWLAEWDEQFQPDDDFYEVNTRGERTEKVLNGRLYLSMSNQQGLHQLLLLWNNWKQNEVLPRGKAKWKAVFEQIKDLRRWGVQEQLYETGMIEDWEQSLQDDPDTPIRFQIDLFYRRSAERREQNKQDIADLIRRLEGQLISPFISIEEIGFHSVKAELPANSIRRIVDACQQQAIDIELLLFSGVMHYRPTGQTLTTSSNDVMESSEAPNNPVEKAPVIAILDGVPYSEHEWLAKRLIVDDADNLEASYQIGERKHGTAMASLVVHGELDARETPLTRPVYFRPILEVDPSSRGWRVQEYVPDAVFYEDRIERAVRRMFEGEGEIEPQAPSIKVINLSFGDPAREFSHSLSPCAKLLDWLSWKYKVLFLVSAGNYIADIDLDENEASFVALPDDGNNGKIHKTLRAINNKASQRRLLSPAESMNAITVGASHSDQSTTILARRVDLLPNNNLPSPINRLGYGFRRSVKPEVLFAGGRQLYEAPMLAIDTKFKVSQAILPSGQKVISEGNEGDREATTYTRGTSNATALATRATAKIYEVIEQIQLEQPDKIEDSHIAILLKTLLVHGASKGEAFDTLEQYLRAEAPPRKWKEFASKFMGYGEVDVARVLSCTEQRATVIGCGTINQKEQHEYRFPLPPSLANENQWRRLTITLAWFTPINVSHRYLRQAALKFTPPQKTAPLKLERQEADHNQVTRGTVQHEILESNKISDYQDGEFLVIAVQCRADAIGNLDEPIDYALTVTLEVKEGVNIPIYNEVRAGIRIQGQVQIN